MHHLNSFIEFINENLNEYKLELHLRDFLDFFSVELEDMEYYHESDLIPTLGHYKGDEYIFTFDPQHIYILFNNDNGKLKNELTTILDNIYKAIPFYFSANYDSHTYFPNSKIYIELIPNVKEGYIYLNSNKVKYIAFGTTRAEYTLDDVLQHFKIEKDLDVKGNIATMTFSFESLMEDYFQNTEEYSAYYDTENYLYDESNGVEFTKEQLDKFRDEVYENIKHSLLDSITENDIFKTRYVDLEDGSVEYRISIDFTYVEHELYDKYEKDNLSSLFMEYLTKNTEFKFTSNHIPSLP